jgi:hypothetical protein
MPSVPQVLRRLCSKRSCGILTQRPPPTPPARTAPDRPNAAPAPSTRTHTLALGQCGKRHAVAAHGCRVEAPCPDQQLDEPRIGFDCGKRVGPVVDQHPDLTPGAAQPYSHRQDLGLVLRRAERWRSDIEEQPDPARPEMDLDVIHPDIDALDQGGKLGMLAWSGQFGPALPDFRGSRSVDAALMHAVANSDS